MFRTAIEAEILYQALYVHVQRLNTSLTKCQTRYCIEPRPSVDDCKVVRFLGAVIKPVHPCTGLIARFAQQNALLLRTTDIRVGTEKKTPREQNSSGKKIGAVWCSGADRRSFEASAVPILVYLCIVLIVHKYRQSAKERFLLKRNTVPEVFPLTAGIAGSGKTVPFEKRRSRYKETAENKAEAYRVYVEHLFSACDAVDARIFSKGDGNMTRKMSTTNLPGARGNAYPNAELDYSLDYEYDPAYAHRLVHAGNRYYRYDANGNITAEKDGPFTEDDAFIFTYNYDPDTDVYGADYGFGLDAPKETEETHPENLFAYRRNYTWNEKNLLTKSSGRSYTVHYRYGEDGQRALKYTEEGRSETLYFNNFYTIHIPVQDKNNPQGLRVHKHIFVGNSRLVTAMTHTDNNGDNAEQREKRYYYHSDHLGSAQFVTDWRGRQYEHIEYTPYGELWIEEVAAGLDKLPFRFTGKEMDEETGLYYYGARYLDPKYSRWLSGDPALGDYVPAAGTDPSKLAGMGGVYNTVNLHLYHYSGNNPVKYMDPDGRHNDVAELAKLLPEMWAAATAEPSVVGEIVVGAISLYILYRYNSSNADYDSNTLNAPSTIDRTFPNIQEQNKNVGSLPTKKDNTKPNSSSDEDIGSDMLEKYIPAPKDIPGIPGAERVKEKTPVKNGGGLRKRWKDNDGNIYEWDSQHGELEKYDKHGKHLGSVDPNTGEQIKPPKKGRKVEP